MFASHYSYGSGRKADEESITHLEIRKSIELNKLRFFVAHTNVTIARELLRKIRYNEIGDLRTHDFFNLKGNKIIDDIRILDMYDEATRADVDLGERYGNWVHPYTTQEELNDFVGQQLSPERIQILIKNDESENEAV